MYSYKQIFKQALRTAWQNPAFWLFGLFVILLGSDNGIEILLGAYGYGGQGALFSFLQGFAEGGLFTITGVKGAIKVFASNPLFIFIFTLLFLLVLAVSIFVLWLTIISVSALVSKTIAFSKNKALGFGQAFRIGINKFWPVFGLTVLIRLLSWLALALIVFLGLFKFPGSTLIFIVIFDVLLLLILAFSFVVKYAVCGVVLRDWRFMPALKSALKLFAENWLLSLEVAVLLFFIGLLADSLLSFFLSWALYYTMTLFAGFLFGLVILLILLSVLFIFTEVILIIFDWAAWIIVFELISGKKNVLVSRLEAIFRK